MKGATTLRMTVGLAWLAALAGTARAQPHTLRYRFEPGQQLVYERVQRTETLLKSGENSQRTVWEMLVREEHLVIELQDKPPAARVIIFASPDDDRLVTFEENGEDRLADVPEERRRRAVAPTLSMAVQNSRGGAVRGAQQAAHPMLAVDLLFVEMALLPEQPVKLGDRLSREVDLGAVKGTITTTFAQERDVEGRRCAILNSTVTLEVGEKWAERIEMKDVRSETAVALDGTGRVHLSGSATVLEKIEGAERQTTRAFQSRLTKKGLLEAAQFEKAKTDIEHLQKAIGLLRSDDLDGALETLGAYVKENPNGSWTPAVQHLTAQVSRQRTLTKPLPADRLRMILRDLQAGRDRAASQGNVAGVRRTDQITRQIVKTNLATLIQEASHADPIVRDLAAFALAFSDDEAAHQHLLALAKDISRQVRGAAVIGLAIHGTPVDRALLLGLLRDPDPRTRGAAAFLASRTLKPDDPKGDEVVAILVRNLNSPLDWTRQNSLLAVGALTPAGSTPVVRALVNAYTKEPQQALKALYLKTLARVTGVEADAIGPYEAWLKQKEPPQQETPKTTAPKG